LIFSGTSEKDVTLACLGPGNANSNSLFDVSAINSTVVTLLNSQQLSPLAYNVFADQNLQAIAEIAHIANRNKLEYLNLRNAYFQQGQGFWNLNLTEDWLKHFSCLNQISMNTNLFDSNYEKTFTVVDRRFFNIPNP